jgi:hypothetical protein
VQIHASTQIIYYRSNADRTKKGTDSQPNRTLNEMYDEHEQVKRARLRDGSEGDRELAYLERIGRGFFASLGSLGDFLREDLGIG